MITLLMIIIRTNNKSKKERMKELYTLSNTYNNTYLINYHTKTTTICKRMCVFFKNSCYTGNILLYTAIFFSLSLKDKPLYYYSFSPSLSLTLVGQNSFVREVKLTKILFLSIKGVDNSLKLNTLHSAKLFSICLKKQNVLKRVK